MFLLMRPYSLLIRCPFVSDLPIIQMSGGKRCKTAEKSLKYFCEGCAEPGGKLKL